MSNKTWRATASNQFKLWLESKANLKDFSKIFSNLDCFDSNETFNSFCQNIIYQWQKTKVECSIQYNDFQHIRDEINNQVQINNLPRPIKTNWGGVAIRVHDHPKIEKYLAIDASKFLAFEKHSLKEEELEVKEGFGLLLHCQDTEGQIQILPLIPGAKISIPPPSEHCIISLENLLVYERSKDFKGMDQDLIFLFEPSF